jgi:hypothetical protein
LADLAYLVFGQVFDTNVRVDTRLAQDHTGALITDAIDVGQTSFNALGSWKIDACYSSHGSALPLPLFVLRVRADDPHHALAPHNFTLVTHPLD